MRVYTGSKNNFFKEKLKETETQYYKYHLIEEESFEGENTNFNVTLELFKYIHSMELLKAFLERMKVKADINTDILYTCLKALMIDADLSKNLIPYLGVIKHTYQYWRDLRYIAYDYCVIPCSDVTAYFLGINLRLKKDDIIDKFEGLLYNYLEKEMEVKEFIKEINRLKKE